MRSVQFGGKEMSLEAALDETIRATQNHLNSLQVALRNLAACEDQQLDEFEDFKQGSALSNRGSAPTTPVKLEGSVAAARAIAPGEP